jgi:hypothetical protein
MTKPLNIATIGSGFMGRAESALTLRPQQNPPLTACLVTRQ